MNDSELKNSLASDHTQGGMLVVVSSPSGGGKGTLIKEVLRMLPIIGYSVSFTTRRPRSTEINGRDYHFISVPAFEAMIARGEFLEWARVHDNLYGTGIRAVKEKIEQGRDIILEIDVQGATHIRSLMLEAVQIFIMPPSFEVLRERLVGRGTENQSDLKLRLQNSRAEVAHYHEFEYIIINDELKKAAYQLASIITAEHLRRSRCSKPIEKLVESFKDVP